MPPVNKCVLKLCYYKWIRKLLVMMVKPWLLALPNNAQKINFFIFLYHKEVTQKHIDFSSAIYQVVFINLRTYTKVPVRALCVFTVTRSVGYFPLSVTVVSAVNRYQLQRKLI